MRSHVPLERRSAGRPRAALVTLALLLAACAAPPRVAPPKSAPAAVAAGPTVAAEVPVPEPLRLPCADDDASGCQKGCAEDIAEDCVTLASMYLAGTAVPLDKERGIGMLRAACDTSSARGCIRLGDVYRTGVLTGEGEETRLYKRACELGANLACVTAGQAYATGHGVEVDAVFAAILFRRACERGNAKACFELARLYEQGEGVPRDASRAFELYAKACKLGSDEGCLYAGRTEEVLPPRE